MLIPRTFVLIFVASLVSGAYAEEKLTPSKPYLDEMNNKLQIKKDQISTQNTTVEQNADTASRALALAKQALAEARAAASKANKASQRASASQGKITIRVWCESVTYSGRQGNPRRKTYTRDIPAYPGGVVTIPYKHNCR